MKVALICDNCGKEFERDSSHAGDLYNFCSRSCSVKHRQAHPEYYRKYYVEARMRVSRSRSSCLEIIKRVSDNEFYSVVARDYGICRDTVKKIVKEGPPPVPAERDKMKAICDNCGKEFEPYVMPGLNEPRFCNKRCRLAYKSSFYKGTADPHKRATLFARIVKLRDNPNCVYKWPEIARICAVTEDVAKRLYYAGCSEEAQVTPCYLKEARAILTGKHWQGKNRCVKLEGDE